MKTSILISSFAALCLVITFAELVNRRSADKNNATTNDMISIVPVNKVRIAPEHKVSLNQMKATAEIIPVLPAEDFSYLKFNVSDYMEVATIASTEPEVLTALPEPDCAYLKFGVNDYTDNTGVVSFGDIELPVNDLEYLRFDVENYSHSTFDLFETMDLPADNFSYLKFRASEYIYRSELEAGVIGELPLAGKQPCINSNL
jgi:hypothetical protein